MHQRDHALQPRTFHGNYLNLAKEINLYRGCDRSIYFVFILLSPQKILLPSRLPRIKIETTKGRLFQIVMVVAQQRDLQKTMTVSVWANPIRPSAIKFR